MKITKSQLKELVRQSIYDTISEADNDKYTHIGYSKYKEKGKEKDKSAPTFKKDDGGKYVPFKDSGKGAKEKPKSTKTTKISVDPFAGTDDEPKSDDEPFDSGGPSYANVPKGAKTSKQAKEMSKKKKKKSTYTHTGDDKVVSMKVRESKIKRFTVKEVRMWMKTLEENRYKKVYNSDCRRVSWMINHIGENVENMPVSMRKKWTKAQYGRERYLAKEFIKSKKQQMAEGKIREVIRKSIKKIMEGPAKYGHRWEIPMKDKKKVEAIVKKVKVPSKDYAIYGSGRTFEMEISAGKHADKVLELMMKMNIKVRG